MAGSSARRALKRGSFRPGLISRLSRAIIGSGAGESGCLISRTVSATVRISGSASPRPCAAEMKSQMNSRLGQCGSELRAAIDADGVAGDPTGALRGEERHNRADIIRLSEPLERLHAENEGPA